MGTMSPPPESEPSDEAALLLAELPPPQGNGEDALHAWVPALQALPLRDGQVLSELLYFGYVQGKLRGVLAETSALTELRALGRVLRDLPDELLHGCVWDRMHASTEDVRRWTWTREWTLLSQDEDLMVMEDALIPALLEEVGAGCTKRAYVASIVAHHARDKAHGALGRGAAVLAESLACAGAWAELAQRAGALAEAEYMTRLAGYRSVRVVDADDVTQRVYDLRRCYPDPARVPVVRAVGDRYQAQLVERPFQRTLHVERATGRMWTTDGSVER